MNPAAPDRAEALTLLALGLKTPTASWRDVYDQMEGTAPTLLAALGNAGAPAAELGTLAATACWGTLCAKSLPNADMLLFAVKEAMEGRPDAGKALAWAAAHLWTGNPDFTKAQKEAILGFARHWGATPEDLVKTGTPSLWQRFPQEAKAFMVVA